jgi:hypothetical protein
MAQLVPSGLRQGIMAWTALVPEAFMDGAAGVGAGAGVGVDIGAGVEAVEDNVGAWLVLARVAGPITCCKP